MRLKPPPSEDEVYRQLALSAIGAWGVTETQLMDPHLHSIAKAMAVVAALDIPDEIEPLFGEDIGLDVEPLP